MWKARQENGVKTRYEHKTTGIRHGKMSHEAARWEDFERTNETKLSTADGSLPNPKKLRDEKTETRYETPRYDTQWHEASAI